MTADLITILSKYGQSTVDQIRENLSSTGTNATGKTSRSLRYEVKKEGNKTTLKVLGKPYFAVVETGRRPTPDYKPSRQFVDSIKEWMDAKGKQGSAYAIALAIHKRGTKLYRDGGRTDIISNVVNQNLVDKISAELLDKFADELLRNVVEVYGSNNRTATVR